MVLIAQLILHNMLQGCLWTIPKTIYSYLISNSNYLTSFVTTISSFTNSSSSFNFYLITILLLFLTHQHGYEKGN